MKEKDKKQIADQQLEYVSGGGVKEQLTAGMLGISALVSPINAIGSEAKGVTDSSFAQNTVISERQENLSLVKYLAESHIFEAQEKAFDITNNLTKENGGDHLKVSQIVSSARYYSDKDKTSLESELDEDVKNGIYHYRILRLRV